MKGLLPLRIYRAVLTGADGNLSKREQFVLRALDYLVVLACFVSMTLISPLLGSWLAGTLTAVLFYTVRDRVRRELDEHRQMIYEAAKAQGARAVANLAGRGIGHADHSDRA